MKVVGKLREKNEASGNTENAKKVFLDAGMELTRVTEVNRH